jgi:methyltransferase
MPQWLVSILALAVVIAFMLVELKISTGNERRLKLRGAITPPDPVYPTMRLAYPATFVLMTVEGMLRPPVPIDVLSAAVMLFVLAKALKFWAIASLGELWTYKVHVVPGAALVTGGPYRLMRHPNYVAVMGELAAVAIVTGARVAGPVGVIGFGLLLWRRVRAEEQALGLS